MFQFFCWIEYSFNSRLLLLIDQYASEICIASNKFCWRYWFRYSYFVYIVCFALVYDYHFFFLALWIQMLYRWQITIAKIYKWYNQLCAEIEMYENDAKYAVFPLWMNSYVKYSVHTIYSIENESILLFLSYSNDKQHFIWADV